MTQQVLHLDFVSLKDTADRQAALAHLAEAATGLTQLPQVVAGGLLDCSDGSDFDLVFFFVLHDYEALEPFGTDPRYVAFLQKSVAPVLKAFAGADVAIEGDLRFAEKGRGACIALAAPEETYDFEIREALQRWVEDSGAALGIVGLAVGEVRGYRGVALIFGNSGLAPERPSSDVYKVTYARGAVMQLGDK